MVVVYLTERRDAPRLLAASLTPPFPAGPLDILSIMIDLSLRS